MCGCFVPNSIICMSICSCIKSTETVHRMSLFVIVYKCRVNAWRTKRLRCLGGEGGSAWCWWWDQWLFNNCVLSAVGFVPTPVHLSFGIVKPFVLVASNLWFVRRNSRRCLTHNFKIINDKWDEHRNEYVWI